MPSEVRHLLIDMNNLLFRAHFVSSLTDKSGQRVSGIYGTMRMVPALIRKFNPRSVVVAWDLGKSKERLSIYPEYKAHRDAKRKPEDVKALQFQREVCQEVFSKLPVKQIMIQDVEADDVIGYLSEKLKGVKVIISNDSDFFQLVKKDVHIYLPNKETLVTPKNVSKILGFPAEHYILWKSLVGDTSDNIKGVHGIGPKKATAIILNGVSGGKKIPISDDELKILNRNKELIAIGALLQPHQVKSIRMMYRAEKVKKTDFKSIKVRFAKHDFNSLFFSFNEWTYPFERLIRKAKK